MGIKKELPLYFVNPLEVRHYLLDLPPIKENFKENAVRFSLRSLYPGNEDTTEIDYYTVSSKTVGIAFQKEKLLQLKSQGHCLISTAKVISSNNTNGIFITSDGEWIEVLCMKKSVPLFQKCFSAQKTSAFSQCFKDLIIDEEYQELAPVLLQINNNDAFQNIHELSDYPKQDFLNVFSEKQCRKQEIFRPRTSTNKASGIIFLFSLLFVLIPTIVNYSFYKKAENLEVKATQLYQQYESLKAVKPEHTETVSITDNEVYAIKENSPYLYFQEIYAASPSIKIKSFSLDKNSFRFEADSAKALDVLNYLQNSDLFYDVVLHQAVPDGNGKERFSISGKIVP